jgi:hypothetical protein
MKTYAGGCHCGRVRFEVTTDLEVATECNCSLCRRTAYLHHSVPPERFRLLSGADELTTYQWGTMTARHLFCRHCGVSSFRRPRARPEHFTVNVRCLDDVDLVALRIETFDGQRWDLRPDAPYTGRWK